jgi:hypothetical protein
MYYAIGAAVVVGAGVFVAMFPWVIPYLKIRAM